MRKLNERTAKTAMLVAAAAIAATVCGTASAYASDGPDQSGSDLSGKGTSVTGSILSEWPEGSTIPVDGTALIPSDGIPVNVDAAAAVMTPLRRVSVVDAGSTLTSRP